LIVKRAVELCGAAFGYVLRYDGEILSLAAHHVPNINGLRALEATFPLRPDKRALVGRSVLERKVVHIHDVLAEPNYAYSGLQQVLGYRTFVVVPIFRQESPIGAIAVYRQEVAPFSDPEIALVETFADQAVIAIENARMFNVGHNFLGVCGFREGRETAEINVYDSDFGTAGFERVVSLSCHDQFADLRGQETGKLGHPTDLGHLLGDPRLQRPVPLGEANSGYAC
jgi:hypothetical protein